MNGTVAVEDREAALMTCPSVRRLGVGAGERYGGGGGSRGGDGGGRPSPPGQRPAGCGRPRRLCSGDAHNRSRSLGFSTKVSRLSIERRPKFLKFSEKVHQIRGKIRNWRILMVL